MLEKIQSNIEWEKTKILRKKINSLKNKIEEIKIH